jgi:SPP1 gp7 family putative phage head morphogenesis protein
VIGALAAKKPLSQAERIRLAAEKSVRARNLYAAQTAADLTKSLAAASKQVRSSILDFKSLGGVPAGKLPALRGLEKLQAEIREILAQLKAEQTLRFRKAGREAFRKGIYDGIGDFAEAQLPFYRDLTSDGIEKLATRAFTVVDTSALDFLTNYNLVLLGDVHRELSDGIKRTILTGIATGKGADDLVRDLGQVIKDPESFRHAGSKVFSKAQYRMETIARTETLRAHNQGRRKFYRLVGVESLEWLTAADERVCPVCGPLDGKVFLEKEFPAQPAHPNCRCTHVVAEPLDVCGASLQAVAAEGDGSGAACLLPPQAIEQQAAAAAAEAKTLKTAFESGQPSQLSGLTVKQLQTLAKQNGISVARTKADHLKLLALAEPGVDHSGLGGEALAAKLKFHGIGALRTKEELVALLAQKQAALVQAQQIAAQIAKVPASGGLHDLTVSELQDMAKAKGIPISLTKQDVVEMLDELEPGVDHSGLTGAALAEAKAKLGLTPLKNKKQLVAALEKVAGKDLAEAAKKEALEAAETAAVNAAKKALEEAAAAVVVPPTPLGWSDFLESVKSVEAAIAGGGKLPQALLEEQAKALALKKKLFFDQVASKNLSDLKDVAKLTKVKHWQWASKDELVTLLTDTDAAKIEAAKAAIEAKHAVWYSKYGGGKKKGAVPAAAPNVAKPPAPAPPAPHPLPAPPPVLAPPVATPTPAAKPIVPAPVVQTGPKPPVVAPSAAVPVSVPVAAPSPTPFARKGAEFDPVDAAWASKDQSKRFTFHSVADIDGVHHKEFWVDENGEKWLFKPAKASEAFRAHGDEVAYKVARLVDPHTIEVRVIKLNGKTGSIQKWRTDLRSDFDFRDVAPEALLPEEIAQVQREQVLDWLISNHDGHAKQYLRTKDGKVLGIDKGQLYKFFGKDKLDITYNPNAGFGFSETYANGLFRAAKQGKVEIDPAGTLAAIREIEKIPDEDFLAILAPYADGRFAGNPAGKQAFLDQALARKKSIRKDFEDFYSRTLGKPGFKFEEAAKVATKGRLGPSEKALLAEAESLGWQGKVLPFDEGDVEDQNALIWVETVAGKPRTVVKMKLRPEAEKKLLAKLGKVAPETSLAKVGEPLAEDEFADTILLAVKTCYTHKADGAYNASKLAAAQALRPKLLDLAKAADPDVKAMASEYLVWLDRIDQAVVGKTVPEGGKFAAYLRKHAPPKPKASPSESPFVVKKTKILHSKRTISKGQLTATEELAENPTLFKSTSVKAGEQLEVELPDGGKLVYRPWSDKNPYAQRGEMEILLPGGANPDRLESAMESLEKLGISSRVADPVDAELLYLHKQAFLTKTHLDADYKALVAKLDQEGASREQRIAALRSFWEKKLGVPDLTKLPGYAPLGEYQLAFQGGKGAAGYRHQYRFDLSDADLEKQLPGFALFHNVTNEKDLPSLVDLLLEHNGAFVSTIEKLRVGVPVGGMSPEADMNSGGASYFFTRIKKLPTGGKSPSVGFYFKKRLLRRMDAISYGNDHYGRVTENFVTDHRGSTPAEWKNFAGLSGNETILKYSVTLLDNIEMIGVKSVADRKKVIDMFHKRGILTLPDGRKVEDIVVAG